MAQNPTGKRRQSHISKTSDISSYWYSKDTNPPDKNRYSPCFRIIPKAMFSVNRRELSLPTIGYTTETMHLLKETRFSAVPCSQQWQGEHYIFFSFFYWNYIRCPLILTKALEIRYRMPYKSAITLEICTISQQSWGKKKSLMAKVSFQTFLEKLRWEFKTDEEVKRLLLETMKRMSGFLCSALCPKATQEEEREDDSGSVIFWSSAGATMFPLASSDAIWTKLPRRIC